MILNRFNNHYFRVAWGVHCEALSHKNLFSFWTLYFLPLHFRWGKLKKLNWPKICWSVSEDSWNGPQAWHGLHEFRKAKPSWLWIKHFECSITMLTILFNMNSWLSDFSNVQERKMNDRGLVSFLLILLGKLFKYF